MHEHKMYDILIDTCLKTMYSMSTQHSSSMLTSMILFFLKKFKVTLWPVEDYGKFYDGDSYIILNVSTMIRQGIKTFPIKSK
jgi:hypothetical protein